MSLAKRIAAVQPTPTNNGCRTCQWLETLSAADRQAWDEWLESNNSKAQLWEIAASDPDNPLPVSRTGFRLHLKHMARE